MPNIYTPEALLFSNGLPSVTQDALELWKQPGHQSDETSYGQRIKKGGSFKALPIISAQRHGGGWRGSTELRGKDRTVQRTLIYCDFISGVQLSAISSRLKKLSKH